MSSVVTCKVNKAWADALAGTRFRIEHGYVKTGTNIYGSYQSSGVAIKDCKRSSVGEYVLMCDAIGGLRCCGMEELVMNNLQVVYKKYKNDAAWPELVAKYIKGSLSEIDNRVLVVGIPVQVGSSSLYNVEYYEKLKVTLLKFGFKQIGEEYKNQNSGNRIIVLAGQL